MHQTRWPQHAVRPHQDTVKLNYDQLEMQYGYFARALSIWSPFCELETSPFMEKANEWSGHSSISGCALVIPPSGATLPPSSFISLSLFLLLLSIHMFGSLCSHISSIRVRKWARPGVKMPLFISIDIVDKWSVFRYTMNGISKRMVIKWNSAHWSMKKEIQEITSNDYLNTELKQDVEHVTWIH